MTVLRLAVARQHIHFPLGRRSFSRSGCHLVVENNGVQLSFYTSRLAVRRREKRQQRFLTLTLTIEFTSDVYLVRSVYWSSNLRHWIPFEKNTRAQRRVGLVMSW